MMSSSRIDLTQRHYEESPVLSRQSEEGSDGRDGVQLENYARHPRDYC